jgi:hypothetical protein
MLVLVRRSNLGKKITIFTSAENFDIVVGGGKVAMRVAEELKSKCRKKKRITKRLMRTRMEKTMRMNGVRDRG